MNEDIISSRRNKFEKLERQAPAPVNDQELKPAVEPASPNYWGNLPGGMVLTYGIRYNLGCFALRWERTAWASGLGLPENCLLINALDRVLNRYPFLF